MRTSLMTTAWTASVALLALALWSPQAGADEASRERLDERLQAFGAAFMRGDIEALDTLLAPHYHHTNDRARALTREQWLATMAARAENIAAGRLVTTEYTIEEDELAVHGDTAIATGLVVMRGKRDERAFAMRIRHTGVWAHNGEDWFRVAFHDTYEHLEP